MNICTVSELYCGNIYSWSGDDSLAKLYRYLNRLGKEYTNGILILTAAELLLLLLKYFLAADFFAADYSLSA